MYTARLLSAAKQDIREASQWYNEQLLGLGNRFRDSVRAKVNTICQHPQVYAIRYAEMRTAVLDVFPYMIHFFIVEEQKFVIISAVLHTRRQIDK